LIIIVAQSRKEAMWEKENDMGIAEEIRKEIVFF